METEGLDEAKGEPTDGVGGRAVCVETEETDCTSDVNEDMAESAELWRGVERVPPVKTIEDMEESFV